MAEGFIRLPPDDVGKRIRTLTQLIAGVDVEQEVHSIGLADGSLLDWATLAQETTLAQVLAALLGTLTVSVPGMQTDALTNAQLRAAAVLTDPQDGMSRDLTPATATVTVGSPLTVTPSLGKRLRVWYVSADPSPDSVSIGRVTATLDGKGEVYRQYNVAHRQRFDGAVNAGAGEGALVVAVTAGTVEVTVHYEEVP